MKIASEVETPTITMPRRTFMGALGAAAAMSLPMAKAMAATMPGAGAQADATTATTATLPWPERGSFAGLIVVGPHRPNAAAMLSRDKISGLPREMTFIYGGLRDDKGNLIELVRNFPDWAMTQPSLLVQDNTGKDTLRFVPELMQAAAQTNDYESLMVNDRAVFRSKAGVPGNACEVSVNADCSEVIWREDNLLSLKGRLLGPGLQWHVSDPACSQLYVSLLYHVTGQYQGRVVQGVIALDQNYLPEGVHIYSGQDPLFGEKIHHRTWYTWGTVYKDGTYECGHFVLGTGRMGFAVYTDQNQKVTTSSEVTGEVTIDSGGTWPSRITLQAGAAKWEFLPDTRGRMPDLLHGGSQAWTPQNEGRWRKVGDTREPKAWFAWGEIAAEGRTAYEKVYR